MDSIQRNALVTPASPVNHRDSAQGLMLFNTDTDCLEFWSGTRWVSLCVGDTLDPCAGFIDMRTGFCPGETIADLTAAARAAGGRGTIIWYDAETGGNRFDDPTEELTARTYWAANCAGTNNRQPVAVSIIACGLIQQPTGRISAFLNVMYDFQNQTLEAWTATGGQATAWRWQMRVRVGGNAGTWGAWTDVNLPSANTARLRIPAYFMYTHAGIPRGATNQAPNASAISVDGHRTNTVEIHFRSNMRNPHPSTPPGGVYTDPFRMLFIRTNTSGFGGSGNARYLTINRAAQGGVNPTDNTIRMALLNVGTNYDDGIGLGGFVQWGRRLDGHQRVDWRKNTYVARGHDQHRNPVFGDVNRGWGDAPEPIIRNRNLMGAPDADGQVANPDFVGRFIRRPSGGMTVDNNADWDWGGALGNPPLDRDDLWGNGLPANRANNPTSLDGAVGWSERARNNNPCQHLGAGWRVPSAFDWWDIYRGDGSDDNPNQSVSGHPGDAWDTTHPDNVNTWRLNVGTINTSSFIAAVITNSYGEAVFLPAVGWRTGTTANLAPTPVSGLAFNNRGHYWVSMPLSQSAAANFIFSSAGISMHAVSAGAWQRSDGLFVRCVK